MKKKNPFSCFSFLKHKFVFVSLKTKTGFCKTVPALHLAHGPLLSAHFSVLHLLLELAPFVRIQL